jgi:hypothetical protein
MHGEMPSMILNGTALFRQSLLSLLRGPPLVNRKPIDSKKESVMITFAKK